VPTLRRHRQHRERNTNNKMSMTKDEINVSLFEEVKKLQDAKREHEADELRMVHEICQLRGALLGMSEYYREYMISGVIYNQVKTALSLSDATNIALQTKHEILQGNEEPKKIKYMTKKKVVVRGKNGGARKNSGRKKITEDREQTRSITKGISLKKEQWEALDAMRGDTARGDFLFSSMMKLGHYNV